jgi:7,8-dihydropterin-6-yl-methyl-4-(beta-D-ribofuranosyl)aminobenzene 5'-phosphate synthase
LKITIIYDNTVYGGELQPDWGFACLVEGDNIPTVLFDTGADGSILLSNMEKLNIEPYSISDIFISHAHFDHTGGLSEFLRANGNVNVYAPQSFRGVRRAKKVIHINEAMKIYENIFSTGELDNIEQSMAVKIDKGIVLITGCSHPKMSDILDTASYFGRVYAVVGGFHGFSEFELFQEMDLICPTHCTQHKEEIKSLYPDKTIDGGAGKTILF